MTHSLRPAVTSALTAPLASPLSLARSVATWPASWPVASQQRSRRNALVASTEIAERIHERQQVDRFLEAHSRRWELTGS